MGTWRIHYRACGHTVLEQHPTSPSGHVDATGRCPSCLPPRAPDRPPTRRPHTWDDWLARADAARGIARDPRTGRVYRQLEAMHARHGAVAGHACVDCLHLVRAAGGARDYLKCARFGVTHGAGSDWRAKWPACGLWESRAAADLSDP